MSQPFNVRLSSANITIKRQDDQIEINPVNDNFDSLETFALFAAKELGITLTYKDDVFGANTKSQIKFSQKITLPQKEFFQLVQTILRGNGLAIVDTDNTGIKQLIRLANIRPFTPEGQAKDFAKGQYLTQVFELKNISTTKAKDLINQFFQASTQGTAQSNLGPISDIAARQLLIVTETASNLTKIQKFLSRYDQPESQIVSEFIKITSYEAEELASKLKEILNIKATADKSAGVQQDYAKNVSITSEPRTNRIILIGPKQGVQQAKELLEKLKGEEVKTSTKSYQFKFITADRIDELVRRSLGNIDESQLKYIYNSVIDKQSNQLVVTARDDIHKRIETIKTQLDKQPDSSAVQSPIQYYKIKYVKASDILRTIQSVERNVRSGQQQPNRINDGLTSTRGISTIRDDISAGVKLPPGQNNSPRPQNPAQPNRLNDPSRYDVGSGFQDQYQDRGGYIGQESVVDQLANYYARDLLAPRPVIPGQAEVTVDENSNTLIVVAEPAVQRLYKDMIERLDRPRPQVLVEVTVVTIDRSDSLNVGIEVSGGDRIGAKKLFAFTQYGLSTVDPTNGALSIIPGLGFNGTLIDPDSADVVLRALSTHSRARVVAAPRILVNDNARGVLSSVAEVPYAQVNASNTVATTSLGGFAEAGTTISVTPQIGEGENLNLEFDVIISDFTDSSSADLPPPRRSDQVTSTVTIPDGHTVIVGGLSRKRNTESQRGIPLIENIPIFRLISGDIAKENDRQNIYVFIKPIILRDDKFRMLRYLSEVERRKACIPDDLPKSCPVLIR